MHSYVHGMPSPTAAACLPGGLLEPSPRAQRRPRPRSVHSPSRHRLSRTARETPFSPESLRRSSSLETVAIAGDKPRDLVPPMQHRRPRQELEDGDLGATGAAAIGVLFSPEPPHVVFNSGQRRASQSTPPPQLDPR